MDEAHYAIVCEGDHQDFDDYDDFSDPVWGVLITVFKEHFKDVTEEELQEYIAIMQTPIIRKIEDAVVECITSDDVILAYETISEALEHRKNLGPLN